MTNAVLDVMRARYRVLMRSIGMLEKQLNKYGTGSINIKHHNGRPYYYLHTGNKDKYLGRNDTEVIRQMIQKDLINKTLTAAKNEAEALKSNIIEYPKRTMEEVYDSLPEDRKQYAFPLILSNAQYAKEWLSIPFKPKPPAKDAPEFYTMKGEQVKSKSEVIIADRLYAKGIPYKYECPVLIGEKVFHPDFTILRLSDRKILYHEHCGKMGDSGYVNDMIGRVNDYGRTGVFCGDRLFFSFESSDQPMDMSWLDDFIEKNYR